MSKIPCRECPQCGLYHDISVKVCDECGKQLVDMPTLLIETNDIPGEKYGTIDESIQFYVQKCSACGALNFTSDVNEPVKICFNCHKARIASIVPSEYSSENKSNEGDEGQTSIHTDIPNEQKDNSLDAERQVKTIFSRSDDDDDDDDDDSEQWSGILGNIRKVVGTELSTHHSDSSSKPIVEEKLVKQTVYEDDEDESDADWTSILGVKETHQKGSGTPQKQDITLTAIRYGRLSFTIEAKENTTYMLGRSANQSAFLESDGRVGNEHCYLFFRNGIWYVKDNHSANGTAVNSRDIGLNGESPLNDGDELKLGHHQDSMAFRITI